jgi:hypothetical protein
MLILRRSKLYFYSMWYRHSLWAAVQCTGWERNKEIVHQFGDWNKFISYHIDLLRWQIVSSSPKLQAGGPPILCCPRLLIQYTRRSPLYLQIVFSDRNPKMCPVMVIGPHITYSSAPQRRSCLSPNSFLYPLLFVWFSGLRTIPITKL